jgi:hypothetical protein
MTDPHEAQMRSSAAKFSQPWERFVPDHQAVEFAVLLDVRIDGSP